MKTRKKVSTQNEMKSYYELDDFFRDLHKAVKSIDPVIYYNDSMPFYNNLSAITFLAVYLGIEFTDKRSICQALNIRRYHWDFVCNLTKWDIEANTITNELYFV